MPINGIDTQVQPVNAPSSGARVIDTNIDLLKPISQIVETLGKSNDRGDLSDLNITAQRIADDPDMNDYEKTTKLKRLRSTYTSSNPKQSTAIGDVVSGYLPDDTAQKMQEQQNSARVFQSSGIDPLTDQYNPEDADHQAHMETYHPQSLKWADKTQADLAPIFGAFSNTKKKSIANNISSFNITLQTLDNSTSGIIDSYHNSMRGDQFKNPEVRENIRQEAERRIVANASDAVSSFSTNVIPILVESPEMTVEEGLQHYDALASDTIDNFAGTDFDTGKLDSYFNGPARERIKAKLEATLNKDSNLAKAEGTKLEFQNNVSKQKFFNDQPQETKDKIFAAEYLDPVVKILATDDRADVVGQGTVDKLSEVTQSILTDKGRTAGYNEVLLKQDQDKITDEVYLNNLIQQDILSDNGKELAINPAGVINDPDGAISLLNKRIEFLQTKTDDPDSANNIGHLERWKAAIEQNYPDYKKAKNSITNSKTGVKPELNLGN